MAVAIAVGVVSAHSGLEVLPLFGGIFAVALIGLAGRTKWLVGFLVIWLSIQNSLVPFLFTRLGAAVSPPSWTTLLAMPEFVSILIIGTLVVKSFVARSPIVEPELHWMGLYLFSAFIIAALLPHFGSGFFVLNYVRQLTIPTLFFLVGYLVIRVNPRLDVWLLKWAIGVSVAGAVGAIIDVGLLTTHFWVAWGLGAYLLTVKHMPITTVVNGLPLNMFELYGDHLVRRAISFYGDPLAAGYSLATGFIALCMSVLESRDRRRRSVWLYGALLLLGVILTFTRAGLVMIAVALYVMWRHSPEFRNYIGVGRLLLLALGAGALVSRVIIDSVTGRNSSASHHLHSFATLPTLLVHPLGFGVGAPGSPEGLIFNMWWFVGIAPTALFVLWIRSVGLKLYKYRSWSYIALLIAMLATAVISTELLDDTACGLAWVLIGSGFAKTTINGAQP